MELSGARKFKDHNKFYFSSSLKLIIEYIRRYVYETDKQVFILISLFTAILITLNYHFDINGYIQKKSSFPIKLILWYIVFLSAFIIPHWLLYLQREKKNDTTTPRLFWLFILFAPAIFSLKISLNTAVIRLQDQSWENYWNHIIYWPLLFLIVTTILILTWATFDNKQPFYGFSLKGFSFKPYIIMTILMFPLIGMASTQPDFLDTYPKLKMTGVLSSETNLSWWHKLLFELSYGSDFITTELFFRGFLILAFIKWVGKDAILPMAVFYCTIHFGKPLGECISSYFGGLLLGIIVYNTRSILGGLLVHLGIAWMMELGSYIGNVYK